MPGTTVLPNASMIDVRLVMNKSHEKVWAMAAEYGGAVTKKFEQKSDNKDEGVGHWYHQRKHADGKTWAGICLALSVYWVKFHANDKDFWGWLNGNGIAHLGARVNEVADAQGRFLEHWAGGFHERGWIRRQLLPEGIVEQNANHNRKVDTWKQNSERQSSQTISPFLAGSLLATAVAPVRGTPGYKIFTFSGTNYSHACAAWVAQDVCFFDSNYGEYWFETATGFRKFFPKFFEFIYREHFAKTWNVYSYGKKAY
jgi:YopT peptidase